MQVVVTNSEGTDSTEAKLNFECAPCIDIPERNASQIHESEEEIKLKMTFVGTFRGGMDRAFFMFNTLGIR
jgi:hypothetical protein